MEAEFIQRDLPSPFQILRQHVITSLLFQGFHRAHNHADLTAPHTQSFLTSVPWSLLLCGFSQPRGNRSREGRLQEPCLPGGQS